MRPSSIRSACVRPQTSHESCACWRTSGRVAASLDVGPVVRGGLAHTEPASTCPNRTATDGARPQTPFVRVNSTSLKPQGISTDSPRLSTGVEFNRLFVAAQRDKKSSSLCRAFRRSNPAHSRTPPRQCAVAQVRVDERLIRDTAFRREPFEIRDCAFVDSDRHGSFEALGIRVRSSLAEVVFFSHDRGLLT